MVFDFKRNYRCLVNHEDGRNLVVFTIGRNVAPLFLNVLKAPEGVSMEEWVEALADIICTSFLLLQGARNVLKNALLKASALKDGVLRDAFSIIEEELRVCRVTTRGYGWLESTYRSLEEMCKGAFGDCLNSRNGLSVEQLLAYPVVFELEGLGMDQKKFFCLYFLQAIFLSRKKQFLKREELRHVLVFDESHHIFPRVKFGEEDLPSKLAREVREYGEAIIAASQESDVSESLLANAGFKFVLRCDYPRDVWFASKLMQIDEKWFPKIQMGFCIARIPVRHLTPFLFKFHENKLKNILVADQDIMTVWKGHPLVNLMGKPPFEKDLNEREFVFLKDIIENPISTITERYKRLGWSTRTANLVKDSLLSMDLAKFDEVAIPSGRVKILSLTQKGRTFMRKRGIDWIELRRGGGEHEYWRNEIRKKLEGLGYSVQEEYPVGDGKAVDLHAQKGDSEVWVEVETGKSDVLENLRKCQGLKGKVIFFFTNKAAEEKYASSVDKYRGVTIMGPQCIEAIEML